MNAKSIRISKFLSQQGICSRREAEFFIQQGWLKVNGETVVEFYTTVDDSSNIELHPKAKAYQNRLITVLLHKPVGYVSGQPEKQYRPAASLITQGNQQKNKDNPPENGAVVWPIKGLAPAGRLDIDSTGLLILTQDGRIAKQLIAPDSDVEKEYLVRVNQNVRSNQISRLTVGLSLDNKKLAPAKVDLLDSNYFRMTLTEGRKRQIRRMCKIVDLEVTGLKRVRIGNVRLGSLPVGKWRLLRLNESF